MRWINVEHTPEIKGNVTIPGSKNSSLALLAAALLTDESVTLLGIPNISDFRVICQMEKEIGCHITIDDAGAVHINPNSINHTSFDPKKSSSIRTGYYFVGALLAKFGKVSVGYPGGDNFVSRPIDQHIKALQMLGATFTFHEDYYEVEATELRGETIYFDKITSGGTINIMLAAARAKGTTVLLNAACDPEVSDTAILLNKMGAKITGAGTSTIKIVGVTHLTGCTHQVIPDRLIAGSFLMAAGLATGSVTVNNVIPEHLGSCISKLQEIGIAIVEGDQSITAYATGKLKATRVRTGMYPGFATDLQQPLTSLLTQAPGKSIINEQVYPNRFNHVQQLARMGADIDVRNGVAFIKGKTPLKGTNVHVSDIRAGISLILAGITAEGKTTITGIEHIERGYEDAVAAFRSIGVKINVLESDDVSTEDLLRDVL
ncbi:UDP-N-acetylglucosamine 1-carboxyvinyltransferase [Caldibacillus lycopersici]|uniref:UDP-N-acetylglucosamine 1-carboxyvinyltransferase n=1 Tax=Perspicuibacillus lycopersici TaxID=1325689 RepID=A0AAE3IVL1_9BACI|nr:UDP-N-acetylglucosamine 1-carboxyvinyltransferase [Perspicuibacillus lycopersici]MCU9615331.1 UDP-N-acetylglucosamine 1-carboxyvinyltransferase [Perspicuibacillus lycopersici]